MRSDSLSEDYLRWLAPQIRDTDDQDKSYWDLLVVMFEKEYDKEAAMLVPNDDNRMVDGLDLRLEFCVEHGLRTRFPDRSATDLIPGPCSFLEVLIGLSRRLAFTAGGNAQDWAWQLVCNLELHRMSDPLTRRKAAKVNDILDGCIWRNYEPNGMGGFFPLAWSDRDQRTLELWYQMAAYINELPEH